MAEFDKFVQKLNSKGQVSRENHYVLKITDGRQVFVRDGISYNPDGSLLEPAKTLDQIADDLVPGSDSLGPVTDAKASGQDKVAPAKSKS